MKIKACKLCGSRKLALVPLREEYRESYDSSFMDNVMPVKYLCGDCANIDEVIVFRSEEEWRKYVEYKRDDI